MTTDQPEGTNLQQDKSTVIFLQAKILYTNWKGEISIRHITPTRFWQGVCPIHGPDTDFYLDAYCHEKKAERTFKVQDIHWWKTINPLAGEQT